MAARPIVGALISAALVLGAVAAPAAAAPAPAVERVNGTSLSAIAISSSKLQFPESAAVVVIANKNAFPSGVAGAAAARALGGPLLLVEATSVSSTVLAEIRRLSPARIIVLGSTTSVSASVYSKLTSVQPNITRIAQNDYRTSEALAAAAFPDGAATAVIGSGTKSSTLLAAGAYAAQIGAPILYVRSSDTSIRASLAQSLTTLGVRSAVIVGSTSVVTKSLQSALTARGVETRRVAAQDAYATSIALARLSPDVDAATLVSATTYSSGVPAIGLAASRGAPLVLTIPYCASNALTSWVTGASITRLTLVGSPKYVRGLVGSLESCRSTTTASSLWVLANKKNKLSPAAYVPSGLRLPNIQRSGSHQLRDAAADALEQLVSDARGAGAGRIGISSGYRSYSTQKALYARYVATRGQAWADSQSARAGYSEHQTGLAADLMACSASSCGSIYAIASTTQGKWLAKNSWKYGFILRYGNGKTSTTGYTYEPWHFRFVGKALAADYAAGGFSTLESYFGTGRAPTY